MGEDWSTGNESGLACAAVNPLFSRWALALVLVGAGSFAEAQAPTDDLATAPVAEGAAAAEPEGDASTVSGSETSAAVPPATPEAAASDPEPPPSASEPRREAPAAGVRAEEGTETPATAPEETSDPDDGFVEGFGFGSYGRINVASNLRGGLGRDADVVAYHPRVDEDVYFELELRRQDRLPNGMRSRIVATVAFGGPFFHLDGRFDESIAVRNLFAEVQNFLTRGLHLWAGSRMWRGDDVYLLNFWPLDNLNTIGGGLDYDIAELAQLRLQVGLARPDDPFHRQVDGAISPSGFLPDEVLLLDRPRFVVAAKGTYWLQGRRARRGIKGIVYGEGHFIGSGEREVEGFGTETLPRDSGYALGAQIGAYDGRDFANLFFRYSQGLAAYNPLGVPFTTGRVHQTSRARELLVAFSGNLERGAFGLQAGGYFRSFRDADPNVFQRGQLLEGAVSLRPHLWLGQYAGLSADVSYQAMATSALDERTGQQVRGGITKLAFIPFASPFGRGTYTRPHLRLIYSLTLRDEGARRLYPDADPRSQQTTEHFLGIGAEWWFDSTSYGN